MENYLWGPKSPIHTITTVIVRGYLRHEPRNHFEIGENGMALFCWQESGALLRPQSTIHCSPLEEALQPEQLEQDPRIQHSWRIQRNCNFDFNWVSMKIAIKVWQTYASACYPMRSRPVSMFFWTQHGGRTGVQSRRVIYIPSKGQTVQLTKVSNTMRVFSWL